ncbi:MAG: hypothetical protein UU47_C0004G0002 [candidate division TM6 bacterium GW2011_GWE2_41_16]|nr:MAG: hypothetical protein UU47_C0004G0002 [candidate division TM6 bacterium GW2011_GWE2_41_16]
MPTTMKSFFMSILVCIIVLHAPHAVAMTTLSAHSIMRSNCAGSRLMRRYALPTIACLCIVGAIYTYIRKNKSHKPLTPTQLPSPKAPAMPKISETNSGEKEPQRATPSSTTATTNGEQKKGEEPMNAQTFAATTIVTALFGATAQATSPAEALQNFNRELTTVEQQLYRLPPRPNPNQPPALLQCGTNCFINTALQLFFAMPELYEGLKNGTITIYPRILETTGPKLAQEQVSRINNFFENLVPLLVWEQGKPLPVQLGTTPFPAQKHLRDIDVSPAGIAHSASFNQATRALTNEPEFGNATQLIRTSLNNLKDSSFTFSFFPNGRAPTKFFPDTFDETKLAPYEDLSIYTYNPVEGANYTVSQFIQARTDNYINQNRAYAAQENLPVPPSAHLPRYIIFDKLSTIIDNVRHDNIKDIDLEIDITNPDTPAEKARYQLVAAEVNLHNIHWIAYVLKNDTWYLCDDYKYDGQKNSVEPITLSSPQYQTMINRFTGQRKSSGLDMGYLFIYKRIS